MQQFLIIILTLPFHKKIDDDATCVSEKLDTKSSGQFSKVHITSDKVLGCLLIKAFSNKVEIGF